MNQKKGTVTLILNAVALGMGAATVVLGILSAITPATGVALLGIGLFALALAALQGQEKAQ